VPGDLPFATLPDLLAPSLRLVFVGINPSPLSVERGHYFFRSTNRFWPAFSRSRLSAPVRAALGRDSLGPDDDQRLPEFGIGFTDVVKRPSRNAAALRPADFEEWTPRLLAKLEQYRPLVACFHGLTGYRAFARYALGEPKPEAALGPLERRLGPTWLYVVPNPSPANAHFTPADQTAWYDRLADYLVQL
jgi:double-stranded uracil-DNA glycosylase